MAENFKKREPAREIAINKDAAWLADAVFKIQKERRATMEEALLSIFGQILSGLKKIETGTDKLRPGFKENPENQVEGVAKLRVVARHIAGEEAKKWQNLAEGGKFRPLGPIEVSQVEINQERNLRAERTWVSEPTLLQMRDIVASKKIITLILERLLEGEGAQKIADLKNLAENYPEMAADLGKIFQAVEIIELHAKNLEKISAREIENRARVCGAWSILIKPVVN